MLKRKFIICFEYDDVFFMKCRLCYNLIESNVIVVDDIEFNYFLKLLNGIKIWVCYGCLKVIRILLYVFVLFYDVVICRKEYCVYFLDGILKFMFMF